MNEQTQKGIAAFRSGDKKSAQGYFKQALQQNAADETAWLWLAGTFDDNKTRILCLEKVLELNPGHTAARIALDKLKPAAPPPAPVPVSPPQDPITEPDTPESASPSVTEMLSSNSMWSDEPQEAANGFSEPGSDSGDLLDGSMLDEPVTLDEEDRPAPPPAPPKPIVQEGVILPDGSSARVSYDDDEIITGASHSNPTGPIRTLEAKPLPKGRYAILIPGFEDHQIMLKPASFSRAKIFFDGQIVKKEKGSKNIQFTSNEGFVAKIEMRPSMLDPLPRVWVDGEKLDLAPPIKWFQWAWIAMPLIVLLVLGTFVGAVFGIPAVLINIQVFRSRMSLILRYVLSVLVTILAVTLYMVTATYLSTMIVDFIANF